MKLSLEEATKAHPAVKKLLKITSLRLGVQLAVALMLLVAAWHFHQFVDYLRLGGVGPVPARPPVAEGFLPIAAMVALKALPVTGQIDPIHPAGLVIFVATIVTAWIFRRALCSWICPIGALSERLATLGKKLLGRNLAVPRWLDISLITLKYATAAVLMTTLLTLPASGAISFMRIPFYSISDIRMFDMFVNIGGLALGVVAVLVLLSTLVKSFWCRYLCPYGALLGIIGFLSPLLLVRSDESCVHCGLCDKVCPNGVKIENRKAVVMSAECMGCASCVAACPVRDTLQFKLLGVAPLSPYAYSLAFLVVFFGVIVAAKQTGHWETVLKVGDYRSLLQAMSGPGGP